MKLSIPYILLLSMLSSPAFSQNVARSLPDSLKNSKDILFEDIHTSDNGTVVVSRSNNRPNRGERSISLASLGSVASYASSSGNGMEMDESGNLWKTYSVDDLIFGINIRLYQNHGKYYRVDYYIVNNSAEGKYFNFDAQSFRTLEGKELRLFDHDRFIRRSRRRHTWSAIGKEAALLTATVVVDEAVNGDYYSGRGRHRYNLGNDILHDVSSTIIRSAGYAGAAAVGAGTIADMAKVRCDNIGYLSSYNLAPNTAIQGHEYVKYSPTDKLILYIPLGERTYSFEWTVANMERYREGQ